MPDEPPPLVRPDDVAVLTDIARGVRVVIRRASPSNPALIAHIHVINMWASTGPTWEDFYCMKAESLALGQVSVETWGTADAATVRRMFRAVALTAAWFEKQRIRAMVEVYA